MSQVSTEWMDGVKLKVNPEKNEFIIIGQKAVSPSVEVKNLGVIFASEDFDNHVAKVCEHVTVMFLICDEFANSLVSRLQYFWQMLWSVVAWTAVTLYFMG